MKIVPYCTSTIFTLNAVVTQSAKCTVLNLNNDFVLVELDDNEYGAYNTLHNNLENDLVFSPIQKSGV